MRKNTSKTFFSLYLYKSYFWFIPELLLKNTKSNTQIPFFPPFRPLPQTLMHVAGRGLFSVIFYDKIP